jgi:amino acid transporter
MKPSADQIRRDKPLPASGGMQPVLPGPNGEPAGRPPLGLLDAVSIIVGIVVGAGIYKTAPTILQNVSSPTMALAVWAVCGLLSLIGALCYAELATAYPRSGGDYHYLGKAFGPWLGFLFGWVQLTVILTGSIGMMAFIFADYARALWGLTPALTYACAALAVIVLTALNVLGVVFGKTTQNVLSAAKVLGLGGILVAGFGWATPGAWEQPGLGLDELRKLNWPTFTPALSLAMILVLYTYGGWNDAAFVAAEVRDGKRNITRALILGILVVTTLYLLVNAAYISALGFPNAQQAKAVAADVLARPLGDVGSKAMSVLVMISALGAINGLIFAGARVYSTVGHDHALFAWMGRWSRDRKSPTGALITQGVITLAMITAVGLPEGQQAVNDLLQRVGLDPLRWEGAGGFDTLLACTAPVFWLFFLLTGLSLFVLRENDRATPRPFKVPFYPVLPVIFCCTCAYMLYSSLDYVLNIQKWKGGLALLGGLPLLVGLPLYLISRQLGHPHASSAGPHPAASAEPSDVSA